MLLDNAFALKESKRTYIFADNDQIVLENTVELNFSDSGNHRIKTSNKKLHIIPNTWLVISIEGASETRISQNEFIKLTEKERTYTFPGNNVIRFTNVNSLTVSNTGLHHLTLDGGKLVIVNSGWISITIDETDWTV